MINDAKLDDIEQGAESDVNLQIYDDTLPWSECSIGEVLIFNPSNEKFYTIREGQWIQVEDVPDELIPLAFSPESHASDEFLQRCGGESVGDDRLGYTDLRDAPTAPMLETARETLHLLDSLLGNDRLDYSALRDSESMEQYNIGEHGQGNHGRLPFAETDETDDDIDEILESIRSI